MCVLPSQEGDPDRQDTLHNIYLGHGNCWSRAVFSHDDVLTAAGAHAHGVHRRVLSKFVCIVGAALYAISCPPSQVAVAFIATSSAVSG